MNPENRANQYAVDLLLPVRMFEPLAKGQEITFGTASDLADKIETTLTATAIRLVECGWYPEMLVYNGSRRRLWFRRGPTVPEQLWPTDRIGPKTLALDVLRGDSGPGKPVDVPASAWFESEEASRYWIREDAVRIGSEVVLSLLWWADEQQLLDLEADEPDTEFNPRFR